MLKKQLLLVATVVGATLLATSPMANAALPGFYLGGQAGWGSTHYTSDDLATNDYDNDGIAGRLFTGYQFNQNWAAELGYTKFSNTKANYGYGFHQTIKEDAIDLVAKGIMPLQNGFGVYGKAGVAYVKADGSDDFNGATFANLSEHKVYPTFGAGVSYDITQNVPVDISWNRIQKMGNGDIESTDFFALGIAYNFG